MEKVIELYVHIPFCRQKCTYCDFLSFEAKESTQEKYVEALKREITARKADFQDSAVRSIYFGGGTPSLIDEKILCDVLQHIKKEYILFKGCEITLEANPCTLTKQKLKAYLKAGFNRLSLGCQSLDDTKLKILGRLHDRETFVNVYMDARQVGFDNISFDLMYALPNQTLAEWKKELISAVMLDPEHISAYALTLEEGTPLYNNRKRYTFPSDDVQREMYDVACDVFMRSGFEQYELSNFAKASKKIKRGLYGYFKHSKEEMIDRKCLHNIGYWRNIPYLGFGLGASSYEGGRRYKNTPVLDEYMANADFPEKLRCEENVLTKDDYVKEFMMLGLRMTAGVSEEAYYESFGEPIDVRFGAVVSKHVENGFLVREDGRIRLSKKAMFVSNSILADFV